MKLNAQGMTSTQACDLCQWCSETAETIRDYSQSSDSAARLWWENECDKPERFGPGLNALLGLGEDILQRADLSLEGCGIRLTGVATNPTPGWWPSSCRARR